MSEKKAVVLVPGKINPRVLERLNGNVEIIAVPAGLIRCCRRVRPTA